MSISNVTKIKNLDATLLKVRDLVCEANRDGFGYSISYKSNLFSEKFIKPEDFVGLNKTLLHDKMMLPVFDNSHSLSHGSHGDRPLAITAHGRTSTNWKGDVEYSHPFVKGDNAFIHNGVVDVPRSHQFDLMTDNDSEYLANVYWKQGINGLSKISGYFAFMNLKLNGKLEVVRDNTASLYAAYVPDLDTYVFATTEGMITRLCTFLDVQCTKVSPVTAMRYFTVQGSKINNVAIIQKGTRAKRLSEKEKKAFKDYDAGFSTPVAKVIKDDASTPSSFNDPHYWGDSMSEFESKYMAK
jgi:predicted glutamine amidotransferase